MYFNGKDLKEYFIVNDIRRSILPPQHNFTKKISRKAGEIFVKKDMGMRIAEVDITFIKDKRRKVRKVAELLYSEKPERLLLSDEPDKYYLAILDESTDLEEIMSFGRGTLTFLCPDPLVYSLDKTIIKDISGKTIVNQGTYETTGQIIVGMRSSVEHLKITLQNTGEFIYLEDSFYRGNEILIDLENELVKKNGNLIMDKLYFESDFFDIPIGEFEITLSSGVGRLEFRERWL